MKKIALFILAVVLLATACGCSAGITDSQTAFSSSAEASSSAASTSETEASLSDSSSSDTSSSAFEEFALPQGASWYLKPSLTFEELEPVQLIRGMSSARETEQEGFWSSLGRTSFDGFCVAVQNGKSGLIDANGNFVAPCEYNSITCGYEEKYCLDTSDSSYTLGEDGSVCPLPADDVIQITGSSVNGEPCWMEKEQALGRFSDSFWDSGISMPSYPMPGIVLAANTQEAMEVLWGDDVPDSWILIRNGQPVDNTRYQRLGCVSQGLLSAQKNGKWGYINTDGQVVFDFLYDESWPSNTLLFSTCYNATDGSVVLCKDGEWALYSTSGEEILPFGLFEQLLPAFEGHVWAKAQGMWGILELAR